MQHFRRSVTVGSPIFSSVFKPKVSLTSFVPSPGHRPAFCHLQYCKLMVKLDQSLGTRLTAFAYKACETVDTYPLLPSTNTVLGDPYLSKNLFWRGTNFAESIFAMTGPRNKARNKAMKPAKRYLLSV